MQGKHSLTEELWVTTIAGGSGTSGEELPLEDHVDINNIPGTLLWWFFGCVTYLAVCEFVFMDTTDPRELGKISWVLTPLKVIRLNRRERKAELLQKEEKKREAQERLQKIAQFEEVFRFYPATDPRTVRATQKNVDESLAVLALQFSNACKKQEQMMDDGITNPVDRMVAAELINSAKTKFWNAHIIAKEFEYRVYHKHTDYLSR